MSSSLASAAVAATTKKSKPSAAPAPTERVEDKAARNKAQQERDQLAIQLLH